MEITSEIIAHHRRFLRRIGFGPEDVADDDVILQSIKDAIARRENHEIKRDGP